MFGHDLDAQAFSLPAADVDRSELAALYTLQHRLSRHAEAQPRFEHWQIARRRIFDEARPQFVGHANAPGGAAGQLFADDDPGGEPAVQRGRRHAEDRGGLRDRQQLAGGALGGRLAPRDAAVSVQAPDLERRKWVDAGRAFALAGEGGGGGGGGGGRGGAADEG